MRLHAHRDEIEAKRQSSANLSIDSALKTLAAPREDHSLEYHQRKATEHLQNARQACFSLAQDLVALDQHLGPLGHQFVPYVQAAYAGRGLDYIAQDLVDKRGKVHDVFTLASVIFERLPDGLVKVVEE
jgi:hypothetical protein